MSRDLASVLRLLVEENLRSGRWKNPAPAAFSRLDIVDAGIRDGLVHFRLRDGAGWYARPEDLNPREAVELLKWSEIRDVDAGLAGADLGISVRIPDDMEPEEAARVLADVHRALYFERTEEGYRWNPAKPESCTDVVDEINEIMAKHGLHPGRFPVRRPHVHRPRG